MAILPKKSTLSFIFILFLFLIIILLVNAEKNNTHNLIIDENSIIEVTQIDEFITPTEIKNATNINEDLIILQPAVSKYDDQAEVWIDIVPYFVDIVGTVNPSLKIQKVTASTNSEKVLCNFIDSNKFACSVPASKGKNEICIIAEDYFQKKYRKILNVIVNRGIPSPLILKVSGSINDENGNPVNDALVVFESVLEVENNVPFMVSNTTGEDGKYLITGALGSKQTIKVKKDGYNPVFFEIIFEDTENTLDFELEHEAKSSSGFNFLIGLLGFLGAVMFILTRKS